MGRAESKNEALVVSLTCTFGFLCSIVQPALSSVTLLRFNLKYDRYAKQTGLKQLLFFIY